MSEHHFTVHLVVDCESGAVRSYAQESLVVALEGLDLLDDHQRRSIGVIDRVEAIEDDRA